jgi:hypothetical protein
MSTKFIIESYMGADGCSINVKAKLKPRFRVLCVPKKRISIFAFDSPEDWKRKHDHIVSFTRYCKIFESEYSYTHIIKKP